MADKGKRSHSEVDGLRAELVETKRRAAALQLMILEEEKCDHVPVNVYPSGIRDNNEFFVVCSKCGQSL